jgi:hypothetical protein
MAKLPGAGFAQSGGKSSSFGGGKGGNAYGANSTRTGVKGRGRNATGTGYKVREDGGDATKVRQGKTGAATGKGGLSRTVTRMFHRPAR